MDIPATRRRPVCARQGLHRGRRGLLVEAHPRSRHGLTRPQFGWPYRVSRGNGRPRGRGPSFSSVRRAQVPASAQWGDATARPRSDVAVARSTLNPISGSPPSLLEVATGCVFAPRCPMAQQRCHREPPPLEPLTPGHSSACFYADQVEEKMTARRARSEFAGKRAPAEGSPILETTRLRVVFSEANLLDRLRNRTGTDVAAVGWT